jgi:aspartate/methionine/tyrosine aminotransferase
MPHFPISARMQAVQTPVIPVVGDLVRATPGAISLGQGVVHYRPPPEALEAARSFGGDLQDHKYKAVEGIPELQKLIAEKHAAENGIDMRGRSIVVAAGGNMAFFNALLAIADPGDEIILPVPYYFNHEMAVRMLNCTPVLVPNDKNYQLDLPAIQGSITPRTRAIVTVSPNNPSGAVYPRAVLTAVNELCRERGIYHISDEAYEYFTYDGVEHFSPASLARSNEHTIALFSMSKAYGFAGWRIGWGVMPEHLLVDTKKAQDTILICPTVISQVAACAALRAGQSYCRNHIAGLADVRKIVLRELQTIEPLCRVPKAEGALYFLLNVNTRLDDMTVVTRLIKEFGVAVLPGGTFGIDHGCTLRVAYGALDPQTVTEGIGRLVRGLKTIAGDT